MAKYEPLKHHLLRQDGDRVPMSFSDIEDVLAIKLPRSAEAYRAWWSNNPSNNVMTQAWLEAGYETEQVDLAGRKLVFRRVHRGVGEGRVSGFAEPVTSLPSQPARKARLFGWMRGTVNVAADADLTRPADADWGRETDDDQFPVA